jgi:mycothiol synthase
MTIDNTDRRCLSTRYLGELMKNEIEIRTYRPDDLRALVDLINAADKFDQLERGTTLEEQEFEMNWPNYQPETDCFLAWRESDLVGYADLFLRKGNADTESSFFSWGVVHPEWRHQGIGYRLMRSLLRRADERLAEIEEGRVNFRATRRDVEEDRRALFEKCGLKPVRYFVNLARPIINGMPPVEVPEGFRLRTFDPAHDVEKAWRVDNLAFQDHWGHTIFPLEEFRRQLDEPHFRPELWLLAEEEATGKAVGIGLSQVDPSWIEQTGRKEGYVATLGVLREYRQKGLGTAMLAQSLHVLRQAGMEAAHLHADAENLTGAMRLYERLGFKLRKTQVGHLKTLRAG